MIVISQFFKLYVGKHYTIGKTSAFGVYKPPGDEVGIVLQIYSGKRADGDVGGLPLGMVGIGHVGHWDVGRQAENSEKNNEMSAIM